MDKRDLLIVLFLVVFSSLFLFLNLGKTALLDWDESIYAGVVQEMVERGNWLDLYWNKELWFEKPPLFFWLTAGAFKVFGVNEFAARFWSAVSGVVGIVLTYFFGKELFGRLAGFTSALALLSTVHWVFQSRNGTLDVMAATLILLTLYLFWKARENPKFWPWLGVSLGAVFMTKSALFLVPLGVLGSFGVLECAYDGNTKKYPLQSLLFALGPFLLVALPWHLVQYLRHGSAFLQEYFLYHIFGRTKAIEGHAEPLFWYNLVIRVWARHWYLVLIPALVAILVKSRRDEKFSRLGSFLFLWLWLTFLFFTIPETKLQWYIIPIYPVVAITCGWFVDLTVKWLNGQMAQWSSGSMIDWVAALGVLVSVPVFLLAVSSYREMWLLDDLSGAIKEVSQAARVMITTDDKIYIHAIAPGPPIFYSDRRVITADRKGLSKFAKEENPFYLVSFTGLCDQLREEGAELENFAVAGDFALCGRR